MEDVFTMRTLITIGIIVALQLLPLRQSRWAAAMVCATVFVYEGQALALFFALAIMAWAAYLEGRAA